MALCPFAEKRLIRPGSSDPPIDVVGAILHVDAGNADSLFGWFNGPSGGIESHFHVTRRPDLDRPGRTIIEQYRNTGWEADANFRANSFYSGGIRKGFVSIETQGYGEGEWTAEQLASIKELLLWLSIEHTFPLDKCPGPYATGVGFHTLYPNDWTPYAKSCPGYDRIAQFEDDLLPWMRSGGALDTPTEEDPLAGMTPADIFKAVWRGGSIARAQDDTKTQTPAQALWRAEAQAREAVDAVQELARIVAEPDLDADERRQLANQIADRTAQRVARMDAQEVAAQLDVVVIPAAAKK